MTKQYYKNSLRFTVLARIKEIKGNVVLREEIESMGSSRQISRCLKDLVKMGELVKIGHGVYAKAYLSEFVDRPVIKGGFDGACKEGLTKLGVRWEEGNAEKAYNAGLSTQVPVRTIVQLKSRFRGKLTYGNRRLLIEDGTNAK